MMGSHTQATRAALPLQSRGQDGQWLAADVPVPPASRWPALTEAHPADGAHGLADYPSSWEDVSRDQDPTVPLPRQPSAVPAETPAPAEPTLQNPPTPPAQLMLREQLFLALLCRKLVNAPVGLALHCKENVGRPSQEPGPHALILLSGTPTGPDMTPEPVVSSRLFLAGEADGLTSMIAGMTDVVHAQTELARESKRLLAGLDPRGQRRLARQVSPGWDQHDRFPYATALQRGVVWDPRMPQTGITTASDDLTADTVYLGVGVVTLDTDDGPWASMKHQWAKATDPSTGLPLGPGQIPATGWAVFDDRTAVQIHRWPSTGLSEVTHEIVSNRGIGASLDSRGRNRVDRYLTATRPAGADLWARLERLHHELRAAFTAMGSKSSSSQGAPA